MDQIASGKDIKKALFPLTLYEMNHPLSEAGKDELEAFKSYLSINEERYTFREIKQLVHDYLKYYCTYSNTISDGIYDYQYSSGKRPLPRHKTFGDNIISHYPASTIKRVLDVGAGRLCRLSKFLLEHGYSVTAIDPQIRLVENEILGLELQLENFFCDDFSGNGNGTDISEYDLVVALEPCDATEHIIRQCLKYKKPFEIQLCATSHKALDGREFKTKEEWYSYLEQLDPRIKIEILANRQTVIYDSGQRDQIKKLNIEEHNDDISL